MLQPGACQSSSRATLCARLGETEAMFPIKYSPKLFLLKKEWREGGGRKCAVIDIWNVPQMLWMSGLLKASVSVRQQNSRGSIKCSHKCTMNSASVSTAKKLPHSPKMTFLILVHTQTNSKLLLLRTLTFLKI